MNTDFQAVFDKILEVALDSNLAPAKMVRRVLVFSDMEFDAALGDGLRGGRAQVYGVRVRRRRAGGGVLEPQGFQGGAVEDGQKGVALVSGFSKNLLKLFLNSGGFISPRAVMEKAIAGKEYEELTVFD
jgi:hypothetical protein